jgi:type III restriction enzyme
MKLQFESSLEYQIDAIKSVTDIFEGLPEVQTHGSFELLPDPESFFSELGVSNSLTLPNQKILENLHLVQSRNRIPKSRLVLDDNGTYSVPNFSIEMETGTGKTYVYLRTIFELNKLYGFKKFIIVVPSVAIREGVTNSLQTMKEHFKILYENVPYDDFVYNSKDLTRVRQFAVSNELQIMVINVQAFQKDENVMNQERDAMSGRRPIEYIQSTNPILLIDEPQSVDTTAKSQKAISRLNPLFILRYSATHSTVYNLLYQLDPVRAFDMKLVKQIEVIDASGGQDFNQTFVRLDEIGFWPKKSTILQAKVTIYEDGPNGPTWKQVKVKQGSDLSQLTNREDYEGYQVSEISREQGFEHIKFLNGVTVELQAQTGHTNDERMKSQIRQTVEQHFIREKKLKKQGIKVLSLFFIDQVKNYRVYDDDGNPSNGKIATWFEEIYTEISSSPLFKGILSYTADQVHDGYFSSDKKKGKVVELLDTKGDSTKDDETYELIMRNKERLLSLDEPLRFIFSHSALKEGWDNPNVFQICTLREMGTDRERRQTIGRGLRLPVNSDGNRIYDTQINRLTVIANESFEDFAKGLQTDIEAAIDPTGNFKFGRIPQIAFTALLNTTGKAFLTQEESKALWEHLRVQEFISKDGEILEKYKPSSEGFSLELPDNFKPIESTIIDRINKFVPRDFVKNARAKQKISYNKRIELNPEFKLLWDKISKKTKYSVEFDTDKLVNLAVAKIKSMPEIKASQIEITKRDLSITESGIDGGKVASNKTYIISNQQLLPDILSFLQRETELTRGTLVRILKESQRIGDFSVNPSAFMSEVAKMVTRALNELVIDGIKYEPIQGQSYEMRLFENEEIETYLDRLYSIQSEDNRTPFNFIPYESDVERRIVERLDTDESVKFFCKLPQWFKVPTPIGDYNPDWAIVTEHDSKLYLVRETKSTHDKDERRDKENKKIDCGRAHFKSLNVNFKVATSIHEILSV